MAVRDFSRYHERTRNKGVNPVIFWAARIFVGTAIQLYFSLERTGRKNIPKKGPVILAANHRSFLDPFVIGCMIRRPVYFVAKKELFKHKFIAAFLKKLGGVPVDRGAADIGAIRASLQVIKDNYGMGIFPQGTRSPKNERMPMLSGVAMIAMRADAPVIPCFIDGPYRLFRPVNVYFGAPIDKEPFGKRADRNTLEALTNAIEDSVWSLKK
jgi:1-acyl-sn-glycerol-3-phosphate acyltransferase